MMVDLITKNIAPIRQLQATRTVDPYPYTVDIDWGAWFEFTHNNYRIYSTIQNRKGQTIHRIRVKSDVRKWLDEEHNQYGIKNPAWWTNSEYINITGHMYTLLALKWAN